MKKPFLLLFTWLLALATQAPAQAQAVSRYTLATSTSPYTALTTAAIGVSQGNTDDGNYNNLPLGFTFRFRGTDYTTVSANTNGYLSFAATASNIGRVNNISAGTGTSLPILAVLWDDLKTPTFRISTTGTAPYRVFTAEWVDVNWDLFATGPVVSFQVKLYETTGRIQYLYTPGSAAVNNNSGGASVGMTGASGEYLSVSDFTTSATASSTTPINNIGTRPAAGLTFTFDLGYDFAPRAGGFPQLPTPDAAPADAPVVERTQSSGNPDDGYYANIPIGFSFVFRGNVYTQVGADTNGWLSFSPAAYNGGLKGYVNNLTTGSDALRPLLAPLWDDLGMTGATLRTQTSGTAPNRIFTVEWANAQWDVVAAGPVISFQVKLFETSNRIWYLYRQEAAAVSNTSNGASIGLAGADGYFLSLDGTGTAPSASSTSETRNLSVKPATGQVYAFAPAGTISGPLPVQLTAFVAQRTSHATVALTWHTASETNNAGFGLETSADGHAWAETAFVAGAGTSLMPRAYAATHASAAPTYYRLRQTDLDGTTAYSPVRFVPAATQAPALAVYPNPAHHSVVVVGATTTVCLHNVLGEVVRTFANHTRPLDLSGLPAGIYHVRSGQQVSRLVLE